MEMVTVMMTTWPRLMMAIEDLPSLFSTCVDINYIIIVKRFAICRRARMWLCRRGTMSHSHAGDKKTWSNVFKNLIKCYQKCFQKTYQHYHLSQGERAPKANHHVAERGWWAFEEIDLRFNFFEETKTNAKFLKASCLAFIFVKHSYFFTFVFA